MHEEDIRTENGWKFEIFDDEPYIIIRKAGPERGLTIKSNLKRDKIPDLLVELAFGMQDAAKVESFTLRPRKSEENEQ